MKTNQKHKINWKSDGKNRTMISWQSARIRPTKFIESPADIAH